MHWYILMSVFQSQKTNLSTTYQTHNRQLRAVLYRTYLLIPIEHFAIVGYN